MLRLALALALRADNTLSLTAPITERLRVRDTGLRTTADPSLLVQSLLDLGQSRCAM